MILFLLFWNECKSFFIDVSKSALFPVRSLSSSRLAVGDLNADGWNDFVASGKSSTVNFNFFLFKQNASMVFSDITNTVTFVSGLPAGIFDGRILLSDVNKDGLLDIFYAGTGNNTIGVAHLYLQNGSFLFFFADSVCFPGGIPQAV